jgi:hypothetical protein
MRKIIITAATAVAAGLLATACGTSTSHGSQIGQAPINGGGSMASAPAAAQPFKIKPVYCGTYSQAQMSQFEDYGGLIFRYTNTSTQPDSIVVRVNFVKGSQVLASNVTAYEPTIRPGQSATAEAGWSGPGNTMPAGTQCQVTSVSDSY